MSIIDQGAEIRTPPFDVLAEQSVLGGMMLSPTAVGDVVEIVRGNDFYVPKHELIFEAILTLYSTGMPTDTVSVADELLRTGTLDRAGGAEYLHMLTSMVPTASNAGYYAAIVAKRAVLRRLVEAGNRIARLGHDAAGDPMDLINAADAEVQAISATQRPATQFVGEMVGDVLAEVGKPRRVFSTPWPRINETLGGGLRPGALYILAGRPGLSKSSLALQIATELAQHGLVAFSSLEMPREELIRRIISQGARIPHRALENGKPLPGFMQEKIDYWRESYMPATIAIDDRSSISVAEVRAQARQLARQGEVSGVIVDYLQLMPTPGDMKRHEALGEMTRQLKIMARDMQCPVIALSQLNRNSEMRADRRPQLSDLRESGSIEQDADVVFLLHRDPQVQASAQPGTPVSMEIAVAKNRHGPTGVHDVFWDGMFFRADESY